MPYNVQVQYVPDVPVPLLAARHHNLLSVPLKRYDGSVVVAIALADVDNGGHSGNV